MRRLRSWAPAPLALSPACSRAPAALARAAVHRAAFGLRCASSSAASSPASSAAASAASAKSAPYRTTLGAPPAAPASSPSPLAALPLVTEPPGLPRLAPARSLPTPTVQMSTLSNGLRITTQETYGQVASLALFIDAGSMYESGPTIGACHFLEATAFASTERRSAEEILSFTSRHGIATSAVFNREVLMYKVECLRGDVPDALSLVADAVLCPRLTAAELDSARRAIAFQRAEAASQPQVLVSEQLYAAAYGRASPLGRPEKCPADQLAALGAPALRAYAAAHFCAPRMVLSAVGVDHAAAVAAAERHLGGLPATAAAPHAGGPPRPRAAYVGGDERSAPDWAALPHTVAAATAKTEFAHMMLAFPTVGWAHEDVVPVCVIDTLLGGGSSFSAGGPGKGMYSRLYREILNAYAWVDAANAFSTQLYDSGVVGIYAAAQPEQAGALARIAAKQLARLAEQPVHAAELARARNQLASSVMMNLETRALLSEDIGRQVLSHGRRMEPAELVRRIAAVSADDVMRIMRAALAAPPAFAAVGDCGGDMPDHAALRDFFAAAAQRAAAAPPILARLRDQRSGTAAATTFT